MADRKMIQVTPSVKTELESLQDLYGFKSIGETIAYITVCHIEKVKDTLPALEHMSYARMAKDWK